MAHVFVAKYAFSGAKRKSLFWLKVCRNCGLVLNSHPACSRPCPGDSD